MTWATSAIISHARKLAHDAGDGSDAATMQVLAGMLVGTLPAISNGFIRALPTKIPELKLRDKAPL